MSGSEVILMKFGRELVHQTYGNKSRSLEEECERRRRLAERGVYLIHDNCTIPLVAYVEKEDEHHSTVYLATKSDFPTQAGFKSGLTKEEIAKVKAVLDVDLREYRPFTKSCQIERVFVGESCENSFTKGLGTFGDYYTGCNLLLQLSTENNYVHIGDCVTLFTTFAMITEFHAPVGNNDVVYSYAIDKRKNVYFLDMGEIILYDQVERMVPKEEKNPGQWIALKFLLNEIKPRTKRLPAVTVIPRLGGL